MTLCIYWGCLGDSGHHLHSPDRGLVRPFECERFRIPTAGQMDGGCAFLPHSKTIGVACLTYLPGPDRTILAWWGSPWDSRPGVNSAIITEGNVDADECWRRFVTTFPARLTARIERPRLA